jgi:hypothetical protein
MAFPGLNVGGAQVSVMPQFTPSNTAIDASGIGRGFSQGLGLVEQAQNARRLRDIIAEDQARRPLRDIIAQEQLLQAQQNIGLMPQIGEVKELENARLRMVLSQPEEMVEGAFLERTPEGDIFESQTIGFRSPDGRVIPPTQRRGKLISTKEQLDALEARSAGRAPSYAPRFYTTADGTQRQAIFNPEVGALVDVETGAIVTETGNVVARQTEVEVDDPQTPGGTRVIAAWRQPNGVLTYDQEGTQQLPPVLRTKAPPAKSARDAAMDRFGITRAAVSGGVAAPATPAVVQPTTPVAPAPVIKRIDPRDVYLTP